MALYEGTIARKRIDRTRKIKQERPQVITQHVVTEGKEQGKTSPKGEREKTRTPCLPAETQTLVCSVLIHVTPVSAKHRSKH